MFEIITDSGSDLVSREGLQVLPLIVQFGDKTYHDGVDLQHDQFYDLLESSSQLPTTSQVAPGVYQEAIEAAKSRGNDALVICLSSKLSGTCQSAMLAAGMFDEGVAVVDSENVTIGERILVERAMELRDEGKSLEETKEILDREKKQIRLLALLDTLDYLAKSGRVSSIAAVAGSFMKIKPVIAIEDGSAVVRGKARGAKKGRAYLTDAISGSGIDFDRPFALGYTGKDETLLQEYLNENKDLLQGHEPEIVGVGSAIGTHTGPGAIAAAWFEKE